MLYAWSRFRRLPSARRWLAVEAALWLCSARLALLLMPFPLLARRLGGLRPPVNDADAVQQRNDLAMEIGRVVDRTADALPLRIVCLPRALAASHMLARRGVRSRLHFGAARSSPESPLLTHAWLDSAGVQVTGFPVAHSFVEIGYFAR